MTTKPILIAGPCMAESFEILDETADFLKSHAESLGYSLYFKASFDKANRTSIDSTRGPGIDQTMSWFETIKNKYQFKLITDIHESYQAELVSKICDVIQIPAFLCRQTDLIEAAISQDCIVNIKKGQFMAPNAMHKTLKKALTLRDQKNLKNEVWLTERGTSFGYGDLVVDMRGFKSMADSQTRVIFDVTHSTQKPPTQGSTSGAAREFAPLLARSAIATGYVSGLFMEVHPDPTKALSDADAQLNFKQSEALLRQSKSLFSLSSSFKELDLLF